MDNIIKLDLGVREYSLNDACTVELNPTDIAFAERVLGVFDAMDEKQEELTAALEAAKGNAEVFALVRGLEADMRAMIDDVFGAEVCEPLFGRVSVYALSDGLPLWANLMLALIDEIDVAYAREKKAANPRIKKYTAKYQGRSKK